MVFMRRFLSVLWIISGFVLISGGAANAGTLSLFGDVNMFYVTSPTVSALAGNLAHGGDDVYISISYDGRGATSSGLNTKYAYDYPDITATMGGADLTTSLLQPLDLVVLDLGFQAANPYTASEISAVRSFLHSGGDVAIISEQSPYATSYEDSINSLITALGGTMKLTTDQTANGQATTSEFGGTYLTDGISTFNYALADYVTGGTGAVFVNGRSIVAIEEVGTLSTVPLPAAAWVFGSCLIGLGYFGRKRKMQA